MASPEWMGGTRQWRDCFRFFLRKNKNNKKKTPLWMCLTSKIGKWKVRVLRLLLLHRSVCWETARGSAPPDVSSYKKSAPKSWSGPFSTGRVSERRNAQETRAGNDTVRGKVNSLFTAVTQSIHWDNSAETCVCVALVDFGIQDVSINRGRMKQPHFKPLLWEFPCLRI